MPSISDFAKGFFELTTSNPTKVGSGIVGASQSIGVDVATIVNPGPGWWRLWGHCRHAQPDGLRLMQDISFLIDPIAGLGGAVLYFGPIIVKVTNLTDDFILELDVATGVGEAASGTLYAHKVGDIL